MSARGLSCTRWREPRPFSLRDAGLWLLRAWIVVGWIVVVPLFVYLIGA